MAIDLIQSDCIQAMRQLDDNCIDLVLTDPPYNLASFMKNRDTNLNKLRENFELEGTPIIIQFKNKNGG